MTDIDKREQAREAWLTTNFQAPGYVPADDLDAWLALNPTFEFYIEAFPDWTYESFLVADAENDYD